MKGWRGGWKERRRGGWKGEGRGGQEGEGVERRVEGEEEGRVERRGMERSKECGHRGSLMKALNGLRMYVCTTV